MEPEPIFPPEPNVGNAAPFPSRPAKGSTPRARNTRLDPHSNLSSRRPATLKAASKSSRRRPRYTEPVRPLNSLDLGEDLDDPMDIGEGSTSRRGPRHSVPLTPFDAFASDSDSDPFDDGEEPTEEIQVHEPEVDESYDNTIISPQQAKEDLVELCNNTSHPDEPPMLVDADASKVEGFHSGFTLLDYQVRAREWMRSREDPEKEHFGGILADEMGLGKTPQALTRVLDRIKEQKEKGKNVLMPTLIVCPTSILSQWGDEIKRLFSVKLRCKTYYGSGKRCSLRDIMKQDIVLTTYGVIKSEYQRFQLSSDKIHASSFIVLDRILTHKNGRSVDEKPGCLLFRVKFSCVVLDEAHEIRNPQTVTAKACCALQATFRWCLTGTPFQNKPLDFYSLFKFLRLKPYSNLVWFKEKIIQPLKSGKSSSTQRALNILHVVLSRVMLRRMKNDIDSNGNVILPLPNYTLELVECILTPFERAFYHALAMRFNNLLNDVLSKITGPKLYACVWVLLLRLRQACLHPSLIAPNFEAEAQEVQRLFNSQDSDEDAEEDAEGAPEVRFGDENCQLCGLNLSLDNRAAEHKKECQGSVLFAGVFSATAPSPSAKITSLLEILQNIKNRAGNEKTIIYSQFTSMLRKIGYFLHQARFNYVMFDGGMTADARGASLKKIKEDNECTIILVSLMAGGTGLNLVECNNIILVDLWWNPAVEEQAFARAHRMGQTRDVHVYKLVAKDTVEERILALQEQKKAMADATLDRNEISNVKKLTMKEILTLLRYEEMLDH